MDDFVYNSQVHQSLAAAANAASDRISAAHLRELAAEAYARSRVAARHQRVEVIFDPFSASGYVLLGTPGDVQIAPHPGYKGIENGWAILQAGVTAAHTLRAADLVSDGGTHPANALRGQLARASEWLELRSPRLAGAFRRPSIVISSNGSICHEPLPGLIVHLRVP